MHEVIHHMARTSHYVSCIAYNVYCAIGTISVTINTMCLYAMYFK